MPLPLSVPAEDLTGQLKAAVEAAEAAGDFLRGRAVGRSEFRGKGTDGDVVSDLDVGAERLILDRLRESHPDIPVLAEESGRSGRRGSRWSWMVDPLDGTNNLAIGLPAYAVGVVLCRDWEPVVSVIHEPETRRTWSAVAGAGAKGPDGGPLASDSGRRADRMVLAWTQGYRVRRTDPQVNSLKVLLDREAHRVLHLWAPLLGWTMLARGDIDAFIGYRPELIDLPGGLLLARECGIEIRALDGTAYDAPLDPDDAGDVDRSFIAARPDRLPPLIGLARRAVDLAPRLAGVVTAEPRSAAVSR